ncbi:PREDICTED: uncharacterized protein LOC105141029 isoform X1 [Populus euphratica]|uniref:Uncharacterized protein LOC105141029 isoform X1 n=1 Tax=Populus euphratica TaxID=75702 RepID=A0AAJ6Y8I0_POPEU|nr:PREDICTED: uncharacterized protein LOC105141029 isoform X1 [Populus euphratica]
MDQQHLDDDEAKHWLPSYMLLSEAIPSKYTTNSRYLSSNMAHHLPTLLHRPPAPEATPCSQCIKPVVPDVPVNHLLPGYHDLGFSRGVEVGQRLCGNGTGQLSTRFDPVNSFQVKQRVKNQVDDFYLETRARVLQRQQNRLLQNQIYPFQANVIGLGGGGGYMKESGGTGVFHPRIVNPTTRTSTNVLKKKQAATGPRNRQESPLTRQRNDRKRVGVSKQEDCYYHLSPEMALPRDWAY